MSLLLPQHNWSRAAIALCFIAIALLESIEFFEPVKPLLSSPATTLTVGKYSISLYQIIEAFFILIVMGWFASTASAVIARSFSKIQTLDSSNRALLIKTTQFFTYLVILLIGFDILGIDLKAFTIFGGALGIGIGFGLQKITANFISGLILLLEKSVEQGDLIELADGTYGFIRSTGARYTLVETLDTKEIMIPNEDFITDRVINWTYSTNKGRIEIPVSVSYESDMEQVRNLLLEAASEYEGTLPSPSPRCYMREYAESSVNFILHFWVDDIEIEPLKPQSDVMRIIWRKFKENQITIPYPQRDVHLIKK